MPFGSRLTVPIAVVLVAFGAWIALSPGTVPGLADPGMTMPADDRGLEMTMSTQR